MPLPRPGKEAHIMTPLSRPADGPGEGCQGGWEGGDSGKGLALVDPILWDQRGAVLCGHSYVSEVTMDGDSKDPT